MNEELNNIMKVFAGIPNSAMWVAGGFFLYKVLIYLSTTGAMVYVTKMVCSSGINYVQLLRSPKLYDFRGVVVDEAARDELASFLRELNPSRAYLRIDDIARLKAAYRYALEKDPEYAAKKPEYAASDLAAMANYNNAAMNAHAQFRLGTMGRGI